MAGKSLRAGMSGLKMNGAPDGAGGAQDRPAWPVRRPSCSAKRGRTSRVGGEVVAWKMDGEHILVIRL